MRIAVLVAALTMGVVPLAEASSSSAPAQGPTRYAGHGVVKAIDPTKTSVTIAHEEIPGFMKAMTMPFEVSSPSVLAGIAVGDTVDFSFTYDGQRVVIDRITKR